MSDVIKTGTVTGTGQVLHVALGFIPTYVKVFNPNDVGRIFPVIERFSGMAAASGFKNNNGNVCLTAPGVVIGTGSAAKVKITNTVTFLIAGIFKSKTTAEVAFTATTHDIPANASTVQEACYSVGLAADGTPSLTMGAIATGAGNSKPPAVPAGEVMIGYVRVAIAAGATPFDASTDLLSAGHITDTYYDLVQTDGPGYINVNGLSDFAGEAPNTQLAGTVAVTATLKALTGTSTNFLRDLVSGDQILLNGRKYTIDAITTTTAATIVEAASVTETAAILNRVGGRSEGFKIGADGDMNVAGEVLYYMAVK